MAIKKHSKKPAKAAIKTRKTKIIPKQVEMVYTKMAIKNSVLEPTDMKIVFDWCVSVMNNDTRQSLTFYLLEKGFWAAKAKSELEVGHE